MTEEQLTFAVKPPKHLQQKGLTMNVQTARLLTHGKADDVIRRLFGDNTRAVLLPRQPSLDGVPCTQCGGKRNHRPQCQEENVKRCLVRQFHDNPDRAVSWPVPHTDLGRGDSWEEAIAAAKEG